jgi:hypothetical protein
LFLYIILLSKYVPEVKYRMLVYVCNLCIYLVL